MLPGLARAAVNNSCNVLIFLEGDITNTLGVLEMGVTPTKSLKVSNGNLANVDGLTVCEDE